MSLVDALDQLVVLGTLARSGMVNADMYTYQGPLGEHRGDHYTAAITVFAYDSGTIRTSGEVWLGEERVARAPLEVNWPAVKAIREIENGSAEDHDTARRLLAAVLPGKSVAARLGFVTIS